MTGVTWGWLVGYLAVAAVDWLAVARRSKRLEYLAKPGCMVALAGAALSMDPADGAARSALVVALVLCAAGDVFLMLPGRQPASAGPDLFVAGLVSFLLGHLAFVAGFVLEGVEAVGLALGAAAAAVLVVAVGRPVLTAVRAGAESALVAPVGAYLAVISSMLVAALGTLDPRAAAGAALFAFSDTTIALARFVAERSWMPLAIIVTYHLAQGLLVLSFS